MPDLKPGYNLIRVGTVGGGRHSGARVARTRNLEIIGSTISGFRIRRHAPVRITAAQRN